MLVRLRLGIAKLLRLNGTPHGIALGFTLGLVCSLIPIPFLGMGIALLLSPVLGGNVPATYFGTAVVNPLTGPAIYFGELWVGGSLLGLELPSWSEARSFAPSHWWQLFVELLPAFGLGTLAVMLGSAMLSYPLLRRTVARIQRTLHADAAGTEPPTGSRAA